MTTRPSRRDTVAARNAENHDARAGTDDAPTRGAAPAPPGVWRRPRGQPRRCGRRRRPPRRNWSAKATRCANSGSRRRNAMPLLRRCSSACASDGATRFTTRVGIADRDRVRRDHRVGGRGGGGSAARPPATPGARTVPRARPAQHHSAHPADGYHAPAESDPQFAFIAPQRRLRPPAPSPAAGPTVTTTTRTTTSSVPSSQPSPRTTSAPRSTPTTPTTTAPTKPTSPSPTRATKTTPST